MNLAQDLAATNSDSSPNMEAKLRSAISRAYYSTFCLARNYLRDIEKDPRLFRKNRDINEHQYVAKEFIDHPTKMKNRVKIGENLSRLRELRNKADYEDTMFNLPREAKTALMLAQNIISALSNLTE
ncbi:HEPN domain-containing protein [Microcoleus asticus]|uniref:HEPN domain-containing protein n=1 Tax=Microcoleus asticus TaxID=2815231 RepID=UPI001FE7A596|nr:HEPN domain-containing protein [Microcoleus asticus]